MMDEVFSAYTNRGVASRSDFIITEEMRDDDPLSCDAGGDFDHPGSLENWVELD